VAELAPVLEGKPDVSQISRIELERLARELVSKDELNYDEVEAIFQEFGKSRPKSV